MTGSQNVNTAAEDPLAVESWGNPELFFQTVVVPGDYYWLADISHPHPEKISSEQTEIHPQSRQ